MSAVRAHAPLPGLRLPLLPRRRPFRVYELRPCPICGEPWRPAGDSALPCHGLCLLTDEAQEALLDEKASAVEQAQRYGIPYGTILRIRRRAIERRAERRRRELEERAARDRGALAAARNMAAAAALAIFSALDHLDGLYPEERTAYRALRRAAREWR